MTDRYQIDPDFVPPEPTPADFFFHTETPPPEDIETLVREVFDRWRGDGVQQGRVTVTGPDVEGDTTGYPSGLWLEGWLDKNTRQLPFGAPWPTADSAIYPPLTEQSQ